MDKKHKVKNKQSAVKNKSITKKQGIVAKETAQPNAVTAASKHTPSLTPSLEYQLIQTAQSGTSDADVAFNQLISCYQTHVLQYAQSSLGDYDSAQDATQETFIFAWKNIKKFTYTEPGKFKSWLLAICKNKNYEVRRGRQFEDYVYYVLKHEEALGNINDPYIAPRLGRYKNNKDYLRQQEPSGFMSRTPKSISPSSRKAAEDLERLNEIYLAKIACLPKAQREVFLMHQEDYTIAEISHALGITANAASQNLYKAKKKMQELDELYPKEGEDDTDSVKTNITQDVEPDVKK